jgi:hypothetical protein
MQKHKAQSKPVLGGKACAVVCPCVGWEALIYIGSGSYSHKLVALVSSARTLWSNSYSFRILIKSYRSRTNHDIEEDAVEIAVADKQNTITLVIIFIVGAPQCYVLFCILWQAWTWIEQHVMPILKDIEQHTHGNWDETLDMNYHWLFNFFARKKWSQNKATWGKPAVLQSTITNNNNNNNIGNSNNNSVSTNNNQSLATTNAGTTTNTVDDDDDEKDKCKICFEKDVEWSVFAVTVTLFEHCQHCFHVQRHFGVWSHCIVPLLLSWLDNMYVVPVLISHENSEHVFLQVRSVVHQLPELSKFTKHSVSDCIHKDYSNKSNIETTKETVQIGSSND